MALTKEQRDELEYLRMKSSETEKFLDSAHRATLEILKQVELNNEISKSMGGYQKVMAEYKASLKEINKLEKARAQYEEHIKTSTELTAEENKQILERLQNEIDKRKIMAKLMATQLKQASAFSTIIGSTVKDINLIDAGFGNIIKKASVFFKMDKALRTTSLSMGVFGTKSDDIGKSLLKAANTTIDFGKGIEDLAQLQASYSDELGRSVDLTDTAATNLAALAASAGLSNEETGKLAANMADIGFSADKTAKFFEQVAEESHSLGLNTTKVIKNITSNIKLLNKYNFKEGAKGLAKMAETTTKIGTDIDSVAPMADKLFNIEGAVEMSAQLQVMGGEWAKLADPFKLFYQANNDVAALTDSVYKAAAASAVWNDQNKSFDISALNMNILRKVAESTGVEFSKLVETSKKMAALKAIKLQVKTDDSKLAEFITNSATLVDKGKATITIAGNPKFLSELNDSDMKLIRAQMEAKKSMEERAKASQTFDEIINNSIMSFKQILLPFVTSLTNDLGPKIQDFVKSLRNPETLSKIKTFIDGAAHLVGVIGGWIIKNPWKALLGFGLFETAKWVANGIALGGGFNMTVGMGGKGGIGDLIKGLMGKSTAVTQAVGTELTTGAEGAGAKMATTFARVGSSTVAKLGGAAAGLLAIFEEYNSDREKGMGKGQSAARAGVKGVSTGLGAWGGASAGAALGSLVGPIGTVVGGLIGAGLGAWGGGALGGGVNSALFGNTSKQESAPITGMNDGLVSFNRKDKFMKVNDGTLLAGTNMNGNKDLAKALNSASYGNKPGSIPGSTPMTINFGEIKINGKIELTGSNGSSVDVSKELLQSPRFISEMTKLIHIQTASAVSGIQQQRIK